MTALVSLVSLAVLGAASTSAVPPSAPVPLRFRADVLERSAGTRSWSGVDVHILQARLAPGAVIAFPRDGRAIGWRRGASPAPPGDVEGTVRVLRGPGKYPATGPWTAEVMLRSRTTGWRLSGRWTFRPLDWRVDPGHLFPPDVRRLLVVIPTTWRSVEAVASRWERGGPGAAWVSAGPELAAVVGRRGAGWTTGLQGDHPRGPALNGGDQAPAGVFNAGVEEGRVDLWGPPDRSGRGSIVAWERAGEGTAGEIAVAPEELRPLLAWVSEEERPVVRPEPAVELVTIAAVAVLPREVYRDVAGVWGLPPLD